jgi:hypothetical protein
MKRQVVQALIKFGLLTVIAMFTAVSSTQAQSLAETIKANIPFDFTVADRQLPAGQYTIGRAQPTTGDLVLAISNLNSRANAMTTSVQTLERQNATKLIFHRYGDQYFLYQVWPAGSLTGRAIPKSNREREIARKSKGLASAGKAKAVETVCIVPGLQ